MMYRSSRAAAASKSLSVKSESERLNVGLDGRQARQQHFHHFFPALAYEHRFALFAAFAAADLAAPRLDEVFSPVVRVVTPNAHFVTILELVDQCGIGLMLPTICQLPRLTRKPENRKHDRLLRLLSKFSEHHPNRYTCRRPNRIGDVRRWQTRTSGRSIASQDPTPAWHCDIADSRWADENWHRGSVRPLTYSSGNRMLK